MLLGTVAAFIDGLAKPKPGKVGKKYLEYLDQYFPEMCKALGAQIFYEHIRCSIIHEFGPRPPVALGHERHDKLKGNYVGSITHDGQQYTLFNVDRFIGDFMRHLDSIGPPTQNLALP